VNRTRGLLVAAGVVVVGVAVMLVGLKLYLPRYIEQRVVAEAKARGIELAPGEISFGWQWVKLSEARAKLIGAPAFEANLGLVEIELESFEPSLVQLSDVQLGVSGSLPRVLLELGEWTRSNPRAFEAPVVADRVELSVAEAPAEAAWLQVSGGKLTRTNFGGIATATSCRLSGFELGKVAAGFAQTGGDVAIGFGDQQAQAAPLRLDASVDATGAGKLRITLTPTKLGLLGKGLGIALPLPDVTVASEVELSLPAGVLSGRAVTGKLHSSLKGFVPPHPPELDGFVFGDETSFDTELNVNGQRSVVSLSGSRLKAGKFELHGGGTIRRQGLDAEANLKLQGALPCDALAGAAAESRLGKLLGRASGKQGKRAAQAMVHGEVSVEVGIDASARDLANAKLSQKIGVGCGLRPLSLAELIALTPDAKDLQAIGSEVGRKLESIGKELGLPPAPSGLSLPALPLPLGPQSAPGSTAKPKGLAAPAPSG
jgi:hypothetical protein